MSLLSYHLLWLFLIYSFLGWVLETFFAAVRKGHLLNRGFLNIPLSPTYGLGAVAFAVFLPELRGDPVFLFLEGMILATFLELVTGAALARIFHQKWWDYSGERFQFEGYICLKYSLLWGLLALFCLYIGNPLFLGLVGLIPRHLGNLLLLGLYALVAIDFFSSWAAVLQWNGSLREPGEVSRWLGRVTKALDNALTRAIQRRLSRAYPNLAPEQLRTHARPAKKTAFAQGCGFYKLALLFFIGAFLGDVIETIFCFLTTGTLMSRSSVVYGPFSVVWGLGAVLLSALLYKYKDSREGVIFLVGTVLGGAYEYACSVFTELVFGSVFWDYSHLPFNLGGRINLLFCFFWGFAAVFWLKLAYPFLSRQIERLHPRTGVALTWILVAFMLVNGVVSSLALARYSQRAAGVPAASSLAQLLDERFPDARMERIYPNIKFTH